ncbi:MAG: DUF5710 domain-containing protein [Oxalicibacterium faecigallinarum]|uniref:DUF5710 domain-containing protein n=1 Tax=Oxalicibacterium faecigallinarum TaxID=573741 RepID=UPI0028070CF5|nr:DUF5710 domain-containing protein [Oxalicibacterium faecigallinarum]MDQ7969955.1 DUF5710 domain-containing protein [Oxalicibacterium faecigallinarum]
MIETPPFDPPYKTIVKTATGASITETLADGSKRELGEVPLSSLLPPAPPSPETKRTSKPTSSSAPAVSDDKAAVYLNVSFADKDKAKSKGARWDASQKKWYVPHGVDINIFKAWWPDSLR